MVNARSRHAGPHGRPPRSCAFAPQKSSPSVAGSLAPPPPAPLPASLSDSPPPLCASTVTSSVSSRLNPHRQFPGLASKNTAGFAGESRMAATTSLNPGASLCACVVSSAASRMAEVRSLPQRRGSQHAFTHIQRASNASTGPARGGESTGKFEQQRSLCRPPSARLMQSPPRRAPGAPAARR
jgi:hypothetical protein